ncbi:hypothetical protein [Pseudomonas sp. NPDC099000]
MTATPVPFWLFWPQKTVPSAGAVWAFKMTLGSTGISNKALEFLV